MLLRHNRHKGNGIGLRPQIQIQLLRLFIDLLHRQLSRNHPLEKTAAGILLVVLCLLMKLGNIILLSPFPFKTVCTFLRFLLVFYGFKPVHHPPYGLTHTRMETRRGTRAPSIPVFRSLLSKSAAVRCAIAFTFFRISMMHIPVLTQKKPVLFHFEPVLPPNSIHRAKQFGQTMDTERKRRFPWESALTFPENHKRRERYEEQQPDQCPSGP